MKFALVCVAVAAPESAIVTFAAEFAVPFGTYCTMIVQLAPGLITRPEAQVPPVMEKAPRPETFAIEGAPPRVSGPAFAPVAELLTVIVPVFVLVPPVFKAGLGALNIAVAPVTVKRTLLLVAPPAVTTWRL